MLYLQDEFKAELEESRRKQFVHMFTLLFMLLLLQVSNLVTNLYSILSYAVIHSTQQASLHCHQKTISLNIRPAWEVKLGVLYIKWRQKLWN